MFGVGSSRVAGPDVHDRDRIKKMIRMGALTVSLMSKTPRLAGPVGIDALSWRCLTVCDIAAEQDASGGQETQGTCPRPRLRLQQWLVMGRREYAFGLAFPALSDRSDDLLPTPPEFQRPNIERRAGFLDRTKKKLLAIAASDQDRPFGPCLIENRCKPPPSFRVGVDLHFR